VREKFYYAILSNAMTRAECKLCMSRSLVPRRNLRIIRADGKYRLIRKVYAHEFHGDIKWRRMVRDRQHHRVLRWLRRAKRKESR
jgi:hypothetical protein